MYLKNVIFIVATIFWSNTMLGQEKQNVEFLNPEGANSKLPFSEAVKVGGQLFLSGQIGMSRETNKLVKGGIASETKQTLMNIKETLNKYGYQMKDVVKCTVILVDINDFLAFNKVYVKAFSFPYPTRTTFAADSLFLNAQIEIECMAAK